MGSNLVAVSAPILQLFAGIGKAHEPVRVQAFRRNLPLKLLMKALSVGLALQVALQSRGEENLADAEPGSGRMRRDGRCQSQSEPISLCSSAIAGLPVPVSGISGTILTWAGVNQLGPFFLQNARISSPSTREPGTGSTKAHMS